MAPRPHILVVNGDKVRQPVFIIGAPFSGVDLLARALKSSPGFHVTIGQRSVLSVVYAFARSPSIQRGHGEAAATVLRANAYTTLSTLRWPIVTWKPGELFRARARRSTPEYGAPMMKTGWRTLSPLTTRMCGRGAMTRPKCRIIRHASRSCQRSCPPPAAGPGRGQDGPRGRTKLTACRSPAG